MRGLELGELATGEGHIVCEDVLITGAGPVGCLAAAVVRHAGARHVVITDRFRVTDAGRVVLELEINPVKKLTGRLVNKVQRFEQPRCGSPIRAVAPDEVRCLVAESVPASLPEPPG